jgi:uncharacterized protein (DUF2267 family)
MFKSFRPTVAALVIALVVSACGKSAADAPVAPINLDISGELNESSYNRAAEKVLAEAHAAIADRALTEDRLDADAAAIKALMALADKLDVEKAKLSEAELMSGLGALYTRKAAFHIDSPQQAGTYLSQGFHYLDRAVNKYPDNITARLNRGMTAARVPEFMNKGPVARDDLRFAMNSPRFAELSPELQARVRETLTEVERQLAQQGDQP